MNRSSDFYDMVWGALGFGLTIRVGRNLVVYLQYGVHTGRQFGRSLHQILSDQWSYATLQRDEGTGPQSLPMLQIGLSPPADKTQQAAALVVGGQNAASVRIGFPVAEEIIPSFGRQVRAPHPRQGKGGGGVRLAQGGNYQSGRRRSRI